MTNHERWVFFLAFVIGAPLIVVLHRTIGALNTGLLLVPLALVITLFLWSAIGDFTRPRGG